MFSPSEIRGALAPLDERVDDAEAVLDSMLVGEAEILAQVKEALRAAEVAGTAGSNLHHLFRKALETGKSARTETAIGSDAVSHRGGQQCLRRRSSR